VFVAAGVGAAMPQDAAGVNCVAYVPTMSPPALPAIVLSQTLPCGARWNLMPPARLSRMVLP
jgi:hypothetical protein